jgi:hypothetical protein
MRAFYGAWSKLSKRNGDNAHQQQNVYPSSDRDRPSRQWGWINDKLDFLSLKGQEQLFKYRLVDDLVGTWFETGQLDS